MGNIAREGARTSRRDGFVCAKSLYAGIFDCQRSFGQSHFRGCPAGCRVAAKRSESQSGKHSKGRGLAPPLRDGFVCAKSLYGGMFDCQRSFGQSHLRGCPAVCRVAAKRSESQSGKHSKGRGLAPPFAMGLFVQNRFTRGYSIVKDRLDRATCVDVLPSVELLRNAANPTISDSCNKRRRARHRQVPEYDPGH